MGFGSSSGGHDAAITSTGESSSTSDDDGPTDEDVTAAPAAAIGFANLVPADRYRFRFKIKLASTANARFYLRVNGGTANLRATWFYGGINAAMFTGSQGDGFGASYTARSPIEDEFNLGGEIDITVEVDARLGRFRTFNIFWSVATASDVYRIGQLTVWWLDTTTPLDEVDFTTVGGTLKIDTGSAKEYWVG